MMTIEQVSQELRSLVERYGPTPPTGFYHHETAAQAQPRYPAEATLERLNDINPWRVGCPGHRFYEVVLAKSPPTIGAAVLLGKINGFRVAGSQRHLAWIYTWLRPADGMCNYIAIDGKRFEK